MTAVAMLVVLKLHRSTQAKNKRDNMIQLSSKLGLVASLIQLKCTKYFCDDLMLVFEDAQYFNSISRFI